MNQFLRLNFTIYFLFLVCHTVFAQYEATIKNSNYLHFNHLTEDVGVANMVAEQIFEDQNGFIWFSTETGLCRFDGKHFHYFSDSTNGYHHRINAHLFSHDNQGNYWLSNGKQILRFHSHNEDFVTVGYTLETKLDIGLITALEICDSTIWIGTNTGLYSAPIADSLQLRPIRIGSCEEYHIEDQPLISSIHATPSKHLWIGTEGKGLYMIPNIQKGSCITNHVNGIGMDKINNIVDYNENNILVITPTGLIKVDNLLHYHTLLKNPNITSANVTSRGEIWCSTFGDGLFYFKNIADSYENYKYYGVDNSTFNFINTSFVDSNDNVWIMPEKLGIRWLNRTSRNITNYTQLHHKDGLKNNIVKDIVLDTKGNWYIGTYFGLSIYNPNSGKYKHIKISDKSEKANQIESLTWINEDVLWIGTRDGMFSYQTTTNKLVKRNGLNKQIIWNLTRSKDAHKLWIGTDQGLYSLSVKNDSLTYHPLLDNHLPDQLPIRVNTILEDSHKRLWVGTEGNGLFQGNLALSEDSIPFTSLSRAPLHTQLAEQKIYSLYESDNQTIWIGSQNGLYECKANGTFHRFTGKEEKAYNIVKAIKEDAKHRLWLTTHLGIVVLDPVTGTILNYNTLDGMSNDIFNIGACEITPENILLAGSLKGLVTLDLNLLMKDSNTFPIPYIISVSINNQKILANKSINGRVLSTVTPRLIKELELKSHENNISIEFGSVEFNHPHRITWAYRIKELDTAWKYLPDNQNSITFFNMPKGRYQLEYKSTNQLGQWNNQVGILNIIILPHWTQTIWAYMVYFLIAALLFVYILNFQRRKIKEKEDIVHERMLHEQMLALEKEKNEFFTNISHELRTPMTLIAAPLHEMRRKGDSLSSSQSQYYIDLMSKNVQLLNRHIEQLLNFSKLQNGKAHLHLAYHNISNLTYQTINNFKELAAQRKISLSFSDKTTLGLVVCDRNAIEIILCNLLTNAIKYSHEEGTVQVTLTIPSDRQNYYRISVQDEGIGISEEQQKDIFKRYTRLYNAESKASGIGIGLAYTKSLVDLHKGEIHVNSKINEGSCFSVYLPITMHDSLDTTLQTNISNHSTIHENVTLKSSKELNKIQETQQDTLLIVEDNEDLRTFLFNLFTNRYRILLAGNGKEGLVMTNQYLPDIILTDVMMPKMNGIEMTEHIKGNFVTSHIPIIMLTAKGETTDELEGLNAGANYYLKKPFLPDQLEVIVQNIQHHQAQMREHLIYKLSEEQNLEKMKSQTKDEFLLHAEDYIRDHISSPELTVERLAEAMNVSSVHLYRKLKSMANTTPNDLIRNIRMEYAISMLAEEKMNISEVAYAIGFNDPKYFSKCFKTIYGMSPTTYLKNKHMNK